MSPARLRPRSHRTSSAFGLRRRRSLLGALVMMAVLGAAACGGGGPVSSEAAVAKVAKSCAAAAAAFSAAPAPVTAADEEKFRAASDTAVRSVLSEVRSVLKGVDDPALERSELDMVRSTIDGGFPGLIGAWTPAATAARTLATIDRLEIHMRAAGVPECGASAWRASDWEVIYGRHAGERPTVEQFVSQVEEMCDSMLVTVPIGFTGAVEDVLATDAARRGRARLANALKDVVPPEDLQSTFFAFAGAVGEFDRVIPSVTPPVARQAVVRERGEAALVAALDAAERLGVRC